MARAGVEMVGAKVLVTGANRGIGKGFVEELAARGAARIYACARQAESLAPLVALAPATIVPIALDTTDPVMRARAAEIAGDVTVLINNAGIAGSDEARERRFLAADNLGDAREVMEVNFFAYAEMARLFAPRIVAGGSGAIVNVLSIGGLFCVGEYATYSASKAAAMMLSNGLRAELDREPVLVTSVYTASVDTRMSAGNPSAKISAREHAQAVFDALAHGQEHVFCGHGAEDIRDAVRADPEAWERRCIDRFHDAPLG